MSRPPVVPCTEPHRSEVTAVEPLYSNAYPGDEAVNQTAGELCTIAAARYAPSAMAEGGLEVSFITPTPGGWSSGDKAVICLVEDPTALRTGSVAG